MEYAKGAFWECRFTLLPIYTDDGVLVWMWWVWRRLTSVGVYAYKWDKPPGEPSENT